MKGNCQTCSDYFQACIVISKYMMSVVMVFCLEHVGSSTENNRKQSDAHYIEIPLLLLLPSIY